MGPGLEHEHKTMAFNTRYVGNRNRNLNARGWIRGKSELEKLDVNQALYLTVMLRSDGCIQFPKSDPRWGRAFLHSNHPKQ